jgi:uncharacterized protein (DUF2252 family)
MTASPFGFLRGAARMFEEALAREPALTQGPPGEGRLVGDLHLENFGTLHTAKGWLFHVNDFDEVKQGHWHEDVLRLLTSTLLASNERGLDGTRALALCDRLIDGHQRGVKGGKPPLSKPVQELLARAKKAGPEPLVKKYVTAKGKLVRDEKHFEAPLALKQAVPALVLRWAASLAEPPDPEKLKVLDVVRRLAGTGSLGVERLLVMTRGGHHPWFLDVKASPNGAQPVAEAMRAALPQPPMWLQPLELAGQSVLVRRMESGEDKLPFALLPEAELDSVALHLGALVGEVHRRLATKPGRAWSQSEREALVLNARRMAGIHHHAYLDFCAEVKALS